MTDPRLLLWIPIVYIITGVQSEGSTVCIGTPASPEPGATLVVDIDNDTGNYSEGYPVVYSCDSSGYGHIVIKCQNNGTFSSPDRSCSDAIPVDSGSIAGIFFATFSFILATTVVTISYRVMPARTPSNMVLSLPMSSSDPPVSSSPASYSTELTTDTGNNNKSDAYAINHDGENGTSRHLPPVAVVPPMKVNDETAVLGSSNFSYEQEKSSIKDEAESNA